MFRIALHSFVFIVLTLLSQLGGLAWLIAIRQKQRLLVFVAAYFLLSSIAYWTAPLAGREPLPCFSGGALNTQSAAYCALNRHYVAPELKKVLFDLSAQMDREYPGTTTLILDANFPFISGFPLLPHLSHSDGQKVDLAFFYQKDGTYLSGKTRSPIGYFAFEDGPTDCADNTLTLRWNFSWLQKLWADYELEPARMKTSLEILARDDRIEKIFLEPHLKARLQINSQKIRFQGCRAARHDDHIHIQM